MPALGWLLNLGFAGGPVSVEPPAKSCLIAAYSPTRNLKAADMGATTLKSQYSESTKLKSDWQDCNG